MHTFVATGAVPGFGTPATDWQIVTDLGDTTALAPGIVRLPDRSWLVRSGERRG